MHYQCTYQLDLRKTLTVLSNLVDMKAYTLMATTLTKHSCKVISLLTCLKSQNARALLVEAAVEADDALMEKFFEGGEDAISTDELKWRSVSEH